MPMYIQFYDLDLYMSEQISDMPSGRLNSSGIQTPDSFIEIVLICEGVRK